jgi:hypothetical protein
VIVIEVPEDEQAFDEWLLTAPIEHVNAYLEATGYTLANLQRDAERIREAITAIILARTTKA